MGKDFVDCPQCGVKNLSEDVSCAICGETLPEVKGVRKKKSSSTNIERITSFEQQNKQRREITIVIVVVAIIAAIYFLPKIKSKINEPDDTIAFTMSQDFVRDNLKAPSTADFPYSYNVIKLDYHRYKVSSYVDSENSFGAKLRTNYIVVLSYKGGEVFSQSNWTLEDIQFY